MQNVRPCTVQFGRCFRQILAQPLMERVQARCHRPFWERTKSLCNNQHLPRDIETGRSLLPGNIKTGKAILLCYTEVHFAGETALQTERHAQALLRQIECLRGNRIDCAVQGNIGADLSVFDDTN